MTKIETNENTVSDTESVMNKEERGPNNYAQYVALGGIINEQDYDITMSRAANGVSTNELRRTNLKTMSEFAGIEKAVADKAYPYYEILRTDTAPKGVKHYHDTMGDTRLFAEVLRMIGDEESLNKLIAAHAENKSVSF